MGDGVWKGVYTQVFGRSRQLSLNKLFDPSTPSMRKGCDREKWKKKKITVHYRRASHGNRLEHFSKSKTQNEGTWKLRDSPDDL